LKKTIISNVLFCTFFCVIAAHSLSVTDAIAATDRLLIPTGPDSKCEMLDGNYEKLTWDSEGTIIWEAPAGDRVLFSLPLPLGGKFGDFGLCKFDLKIEGGSADVMVFVEEPSKRRRVYRPIDIKAPHDGWNTIHIDLNQPEMNVADAVPNPQWESFFKPDRPRVTFNLGKEGSVQEQFPRSQRLSNPEILHLLQQHSFFPPTALRHYQHSTVSGSCRFFL